VQFFRVQFGIGKDENSAKKWSQTPVNTGLDAKSDPLHDPYIPLKYQLKDLLRDWELDPVILHEQPNLGRAIIEKFEYFSDKVKCTIVLLTPDDEGCLSGSDNLKPRARQNVVFELGYFYAKLGRGKVICIHKGDIELPSDISGIIYIPFESDLKKEVYFDLRKELKAIGFTIGD